MSVQDICNFITDYKGEEDLVETFNLKTEEDLSNIQKTIRSTITRFHLTTETPLVASCNYKKRATFKKISKIVQNIDFWRVICRIIVAATVVFCGLYLFKCLAVKVYNQAVQDVSNGTYHVLDGSYTRPATVDDFMQPLHTAGFGGIFTGIGILKNSCLMTYRQMTHICLNHAYEIEARIENNNRSLPQNLANHESEDKAAYIDPITFDDIPKNKARLYRYLHPTNYVVETSSCIKAILQTNLKTDRSSVQYTEHPIERGESGSDSRLEFNNEICKTFGFNDINELYECWKVSVTEIEIRQKIIQDNISKVSLENILNLPLDDPTLYPQALEAMQGITLRKRELKFLSLFDESLYELLPAFQPLQASESYLD